MRANQAKKEADQRQKVLLAEVEDMLSAEYEARDELWNEAVVIAEEAAAKANELIAARCLDLGIPAKHAPRLELGWRGRSPEFGDSRRRGELRKLAEAKLAALTATAKTEIDAKALDIQEELIIPSLGSDEARAFVKKMPTAEQLMPSLSLDDLGVTHWQPPTDAAAQLLTPSTPADRKRKQILRAIEAHPEASNRKIAQIAGVDHKTVAAYRDTGGEFPTDPGEFPATDDAEGQE